ncbi:accessory gene regulator B [Lachnospiraceae bacterium PF1-21]
MMLEKVILNKMILHEVILVDEDIALYKYGISTLVMLILNILTAVFIGLIVGEMPLLIIFFVTFIPLRSFAGGLHLKSKVQCYILSNTVIMLVLILNNILSKHFFEILIIGIFSLLYLWVVPVYGSRVRPICVQEKVIFTKKKRKVIIANIMLLISSVFIMKSEISVVLCSSYVLTSLLVVLERIANKIKRK